MQDTKTIIDRSQSIWELIDKANPKLKRDFGFCISIEGFDDLQGELGSVLDFDLDELIDLNKSSMLWAVYLSDIIGHLNVSIERYKNMLDIYEYLDSISVKDPDEFQINAPKYKIDSRNIPIAIQIVTERKNDLTAFVKILKVLATSLDAYKDYASANYYKTSSLIASSRCRAYNNAF